MSVTITWYCCTLTGYRLFFNQLMFNVQPILMFQLFIVIKNSSHSFLKLSQSTNQFNMVTFFHFVSLAFGNTVFLVYESVVLFLVECITKCHGS